jgi:hypothetical protein
VASESKILDVEAIKTLPYAPLLHPFVERLIGTNAVNVSTARCSGRPVIWSGSSLISNVTLTVIEPTRGLLEELPDDFKPLFPRGLHHGVAGQVRVAHA